MLQNIVFEELLFCYCALFKRGHVITEFSQRMAPVLCLSDFNIFLRMGFKLQLLR